MKLWRLKLPLHPTWHFTVLCAGVVVGLGLSQASWATIFSSFTWVLVGASIFLFVMAKPLVWLILLAFLAGGLIGISRGSADQLARLEIALLIGQEVTITAKVSEDVDIGKRGETILRLSNIHFNQHQFSGQIWATLDGPGPVQRSDSVTLSGKLGAGFGSFVGTIYQAEVQKVQRPEPGDVALRVREDFGDKVRQNIDEPSASLGMGYLTGQRRSLPPELDEALRLAGLTHIVVASGYNLTILVRAVKRLFEKRSRYLTLFLSGLLIVGFIGVTGLSPSMTRAGLVAGLALVAWYFGRRFHPVTLLLFAAAATGLFNPSFVWGNLGWQLSFAAFAGVMVIAPIAQSYFFGDKKPSQIRQILGETISAQLMTAPLLLYSFGQISNVAVIANLLVLPLVPLAMLLTWLTGLFEYLLPVVSSVISLPTQWLLDYMVMVANTTANVSWVQTKIDLSFLGVVVSYSLICLVIWWMWRASGLKLRSTSIID